MERLAEQTDHGGCVCESCLVHRREAEGRPLLFRNILPGKHIGSTRGMIRPEEGSWFNSTNQCSIGKSTLYEYAVLGEQRQQRASVLSWRYFARIMVCLLDAPIGFAPEGVVVSFLRNQYAQGTLCLTVKCF